MPEVEFLKGTRDADALYDHLTKVLLRVIKEKPTNAFAEFERLSVQVKQETVAYSNLNEQKGTNDADSVEVIQRAKAGFQSVLDLIQPPKKKKEGEDGEEEEEEEEPEKLPIPNFMQQASLLSWAGVSLGEEETYRLMLSIQQLTTKKELQQVRFWGKIFGTKADYYVVEGKLDEYGEEEETPRLEPMGTGANEYVYFVTNAPGLPWTQLPAVRPDHIIAARQMRRFLTGDLSAPVKGFPRFPWGEAAFLRAQIARITAGTVLVPNGVFNLEGEADEEQAITENEEYDGIDLLSYDTLHKWHHGRTGIMSEGRTTPYQDPDAVEEDEEDQSEEKKAALAAKEKPLPKLRTVYEDEAEAQGACWALRVHPHMSDVNAALSLHSILWPGAVTIGQKKLCLNVYTGWGLKYSITPFRPMDPPLFAKAYVSTITADGVDPLQEQTDLRPPAGVSIEDDAEAINPDEDNDADLAEEGGKEDVDEE